MEKISFNEWKNSMSFMIDDNFDNKFLHSIDELSDFINYNGEFFSDEEALAEFLINEDSFAASLKLKAFISLIGLSEERLKRVVSLVRYRFKNDSFNTEWSINQISRKMQTDVEFKQLLVEFFIKGRNSKIGTEIPLYYMRNFRILDPEFTKDLQNPSYVKRILNDNEIQDKYSNKVGDHVERIIQERIIQHKVNKRPDLTYDTQKEFPLLNKNIDILIPNVDSANILIESSYNITTGSGQSKRADQLVEFYTALMRHNANHRQNKIIIMNYCDGFGWLGRQNDLHRIYDASDFVFNQKNLNVLDEVLDEYYPEL